LAGPKPVTSNALQAGRSRVRFLIASVAFFIDIIHPAALWHWIRPSLLTEMITNDIFWGPKAAGV